ncbi:hypothetical protein PF003_g36816 [Phytophthora fragariae]|nr:hypothetical protein PF003_g36816 [Phytophthora fragariae]
MPEGELLGSTRGADETTGDDGCEEDGLGVESDASGPCSSSSQDATRKSWLVTSTASIRGEAIPPSNKTKRSTTTSTRLIQAPTNQAAAQGVGRIEAAETHPKVSFFGNG